MLAAIVQWIRPRQPFCGPGFKSQPQLSSINAFLIYTVENDAATAYIRYFLQKLVQFKRFDLIGNDRPTKITDQARQKGYSRQFPHGHSIEIVASFNSILKVFVIGFRNNEIKEKVAGIDPYLIKVVKHSKLTMTILSVITYLRQVLRLHLKTQNVFVFNFRV